MLTSTIFICTRCGKKSRKRHEYNQEKPMPFLVKLKYFFSDPEYEKHRPWVESVSFTLLSIFPLYLLSGIPAYRSGYNHPGLPVDSVIFRFFLAAVLFIMSLIRVIELRNDPKRFKYYLFPAIWTLLIAIVWFTPWNEQCQSRGFSDRAEIFLTEYRLVDWLAEYEAVNIYPESYKHPEEWTRINHEDWPDHFSGLVTLHGIAIYHKNDEPFIALYFGRTCAI
jgi:hypothetical protein